MNSVWKKVLAGGLSALLLTGCAMLSFPAEEYVQALCDVYYREEFEDYQTLTGAKEQEVQKDYEEALFVQAQIYMDYFGVDDLDEETMGQLEQFVQKVYAYADYDVSSVEEKGNDFCVKVEIKPLAFYKLAQKEIESYQEDFRQKTEDGEYLKLEDTAYQSEYVQGLLEVYEQHLEELEYEDKVTCQLVLQKSGKEYVVLEKDFAKLDEIVVAFEK